MTVKIQKTGDEQFPVSLKFGYGPPQRLTIKAADELASNLSETVALLKRACTPRVGDVFTTGKAVCEVVGIDPLRDMVTARCNYGDTWGGPTSSTGKEWEMLVLRTIGEPTCAAFHPVEEKETE